MSGIKKPVTLESQFSYKQHYTVLDPQGPIGALKSLEVGCEFLTSFTVLAWNFTGGRIDFFVNKCLI